MPTSTRAPDTVSKLGRAVEIGFIALSALVALGVAVVFLALLGVPRSSSAPRRQSTSLTQDPGGRSVRVHPAVAAPSSRSPAPRNH